MSTKNVQLSRGYPVVLGVSQPCSVKVAVIIMGYKSSLLNRLQSSPGRDKNHVNTQTKVTGIKGRYHEAQVHIIRVSLHRREGLGYMGMSRD